MATLRGTSGSNDLFGTLGNDLFTLGAGDDYGYGSAGNDRMNGSTGADTLSGDDGADRLLGGAGDDVILDQINYLTLDTQADFLKGGNGNDYIQGGLGGDTHIGGGGGDYISMVSGAAYGDEIGAQRVAGNDFITTDLSLNFGVGRTMTGGRGADGFEVWAYADDGVATDVRITDFRAAEGDQLFLRGDVQEVAVVGGDTVITVSGDHVILAGVTDFLL